MWKREESLTRALVREMEGWAVLSGIMGNWVEDDTSSVWSKPALAGTLRGIP